MTKEAIAKSPSGRVRRTPVGTRNILTVSGKDPNYVYRVVNDVGDRLQELQDQGYELVEAADVRVGDKRVSQATPEGTKAQVSIGGGLKGYVMRIRKEWYDEDQTAKQARIDKLEQSMKQDAQTGNYGSITIERR